MFVGALMVAVSIFSWASVGWAAWLRDRATVCARGGESLEEPATNEGLLMYF